MIELIFVALICGDCMELPPPPILCPVPNFDYSAGVIDAPCSPFGLSCQAVLVPHDSAILVECTGPVVRGLFSDGFE